MAVFIVGCSSSNKDNFKQLSDDEMYEYKTVVSYNQTIEDQAKSRHVSNIESEWNTKQLAKTCYRLATNYDRTNNSLLINIMDTASKNKSSLLDVRTIGQDYMHHISNGYSGSSYKVINLCKDVGTSLGVLGALMLENQNSDTYSEDSLNVIDSLKKKSYQLKKYIK